MELAIDPINPYSAWALYGEDGGAVRGSLILTVLSGLLLSYSISRLHF
jgi:hypothetical protein